MTIKRLNRESRLELLVYARWYARTSVLLGLIKYILGAREVVGERDLLTAGGVVFFQRGKLGPNGERVRFNTDTEFVNERIRI